MEKKGEKLMRAFNFFTQPGPFLHVDISDITVTLLEEEGEVATGKALLVFFYFC